MAQRATIASHALDDARIDLTPVRDRRTPVEAPSVDFYTAAGDVYAPLLPEPSDQVRKFVGSPLRVDESNLLGSFASLRAAGKREKLLPYPIRLPATQIADLERLRAERGIIPAEFIRDAVASCLALLLKS